MKQKSPDTLPTTVTQSTESSSSSDRMDPFTEIEIQRAIRFSYLLGVICGVSSIGFGWFLLEVMTEGIRNQWSFNIQGLIIMSVHIAIVTATGIYAMILLKLDILRKSVYDKQILKTRKHKFLQFMLTFMCCFNSLGYALIYVPMGTSFWIWILRWVPWCFFCVMTVIF